MNIPNYPQNLDEFYSIIKPYYDQEQPLDLFFELYILDVIGHLPETSKKIIDEFSHKHPAFFEEYGFDWKQGTKSQLDLSGTIDIAIQDLWIRNSKIVEESGDTYHPWHFAINFLDKYFEEDSKIDVWEGDSLQLAIQRIQES